MEPVEKEIRIVEILNPFRPADERKTHALAIQPHESPRDAMARAGIDPDRYEIERCGEILPPDLAIELRAGDELMLHPRIESGFWGMLGMIALLAGLTLITGGIGAVAAFGVLGASLPYVAVGLALGGAALVTWSIVSASSPQANPSATYDPTGQKMLAQPGVPVPKGYGTFAWKGNVISNYADFEGKDQYVNMLVCFGFGKAKSISNILINGRTASQYRDLGYYTRLGTNDQGPIPGFNKTVNTYAVGSEMVVAAPVIVPGTGTSVQGLQIGIKFPGGLIRYDDHGNPKEVSFAYKVEISPHGQNNWTEPIFPRTTSDVVTTDDNGYQHYPYWVVVPTDRFKSSDIVYSTDTDEGAHYPGETWTQTMSVKVYNIDNTNYSYDVTLTGEWQPCDPGLDQQNVTDWWGGWRIVSEMTPSSFFDVCNVYGLAPGQWDTRVTFWGAGPHNQSIPEGDVTDGHYQAQGWVWYINELEFTDFAYPNMILVGIRALCSTQISAGSIDIQATIEHDLGEDTTIPAQLASYETDNPAVVAYDLITNPLYGMGFGAQFVDIASFVRWAERCDQTVTNSDGSTPRRFVFAGIFDQSSNGWNCLQQVGNMSQAMVGMPGGKFTASLDGPDLPVQIFNVNNIAKDSFRETWVSLDDRSNMIEATFADAARNFKRDLPVSVMTADDLNSGLPPKSTRVNLLGCTSRDQAWRWAYQHLLSTKLCLRTVTFKTRLAGIACRQGSVIAVQHDVPQWAYGGLILAGSTTTVVNIDRADIPAFVANQGWTLSVQHPTLSRGSFSVSSVTAGAVNTVTLATAPTGRILRLQSSDGTFETSVRGVTGAVLTVDSLGALAAGQTVDLYDQDVVEVAVVSGVTLSANSAQITVETAFSQAPVADAPYAYGQSNGTQPAKLFRVVSIRKSGDQQVEISALEYQSLVYEDNIPQYGETVSAPTVSAPVSDLTLTEVYQNGAVAGNADASVVSIGWTNGPGTAGAQVEFSIDGAELQFLTRTTGSSATLSCAAGVTLEVVVTGFDSLGNLDFTDQQTASLGIAASGSGSTPPPPSGLSIEDDTSTAIIASDGTSVPRLLVSWTSPADVAVTEGGKISIQYQLATTPSGTPGPQPILLNPTLVGSGSNQQWVTPWVDAGSVAGSATSAFIPGITQAQFQQIAVRIQSVRPDGSASIWIEVSNHQLSFPRPVVPIGVGGGGPRLYFTDSGKYLDQLEPAEAGADVTAGKSLTVLTDRTLGNIADDAGSGRTAQLTYALPLMGGSEQWYKLGTVTFSTVGTTASLTLSTGSGYNSNSNNQTQVTVQIRTGNNVTVPNLSGLTAQVFGNQSIFGLKAAAVGGSTAANNAAWDIYVEFGAYANGHYTVSLLPGDTWVNSGATASDPGAASSTVVVGTVANVLDPTGNLYGTLPINGTVKTPIALSTLHDRVSSTIAQSVGSGLDNVGDGTNYKRVGSAHVGAGGTLTYSGGATIDSLQPAQSGADVTAQNAVTLLQNPSFAAGSAGWSLQSGWSIGSYSAAGLTAPPAGATTVGVFNKSTSTTSALENTQVTACAQGAIVAAQCYASGLSGSAASPACVRVTFWNASAQLLLSSEGNGISAGAGWVLSRCVATAPAGTAYVTVDFAVFSGTGTWGVSGFSATMQPQSLSEVPDGGGRYASGETGSDQTSNHAAVTSGTFPASVVSLTQNVATTLLSVTLNVGGASDVFSFLFWIPAAQYTSSDTVKVLVDGAGSYGHGNAPNGMLLGTVSGLSAGTHTLSVSYTSGSNISGNSYLANIAFGMVQQISASAAGFNTAPSGGGVVARPFFH